MEININTPAYYKERHGIDSEIYGLCQEIYQYFRNKKYSNFIDTIGIIPIVAPKELIEQGKYKEVKKCFVSYGFADVNLFIDYETYIEAGVEEKKVLIVKNILASVKAVKTKGKIDYDAFEKDMYIFCKEKNIIID